MKKLGVLLSLVLLFSLVLAACGGTSGSGGSSSGSGGATLNVTMTDFKFNPATYNVTAGQQVTVNLKNTGSVAHTWTVMKTPISGSYTDANASDVLFNSDQVQAGGSKTVTFTAPSTPGDYQVICTVPGHFEAGMVAHLIVK
jgi:plastocyanin